MPNSQIPQSPQSLLEPQMDLEDPLATLVDTDWYDTYINNRDLFLCEKEVIVQAHQEAPTPESKGYIYGIYESRHRIAVFTGRAFA